MIRVLYVTEALTRNSGVTTVLMNLVENIASNDIKIDLLTYDNGDLDIIEELKLNGVNVYYVPELGLKSFLQFKEAVDIFFKNNKYDIVHSHFNQVDSIVFKIAKKYGVKVCISHSHNTKLSDSKLKAFRNRILCYDISKKATVWAACSLEAGICLYGNKFIDSKQKYIIRNGIDCDKFKYNEDKRKLIRKEFNVSDDEILIGNVGGFRKQKNHLFLIEVFKELYSKNNKYKLLLVGDGILKNEVVEKVKDLNLQDRVIFAGTRKDIDNVMCGIDLFILPSLYEGLPLVGVEAQSSGLPCVFSSSITKELDLTGVIYIDLDLGEKEWAKQIDKIDFTRRNNNSLIVNKGYDIKTECEKVKKFYKACVKSKV